ncbi:MAG TPA: S41 family peptidase [Phycisphaerae bacterium]|nr:S41 family peptidase [Phycisphaerae bacterium]
MNQRHKTSILVLAACGMPAVCLAVAPLSGGAQTPADAAMEMPDTIAGQRAAAFFGAFNSGDDARMREFETNNRASSSLKTRTIDDRVQQSRSLRDQWGDLTPQRVLQSAERDLTLLVHLAAPDDNFSFQFQLEEKPPHGLVALQITGPVRPGMVETFSKSIDEAIRNDTIEAAARTLREGYVYPEVGKKMADALARYQAEGRYDGITSAGQLASTLTADVFAICNDRHFSIRPAGLRVGGSPCGPQSGPDIGAQDNYGFRKAELLPGNVGYVKLDMFHPSTEAQQIAAAALASVADCDALIFDVRDNGGGSPEMIRFISSYLFDKPTHLNSFYNRLGDKTSETWTTEDVPGKRFRPDLPVYVLTSGFTGSGAEEFTYNLKHLSRATIVGETTGGAAHTVTERMLNDHFEMRLPFGRAYNPITKTNWEGVGVKPHIAVSRSEALETALQDAARKISVLSRPSGA